MADWKDLKLKIELKEGQSHVLVNERVWELLYRTYSGFPEIPLFLIDNGKHQASFGISPDSKNTIHAKQYKYGVPDTYAKVAGFTFKGENLSSLISRAMTPKQLIFYFCRKWRLDPADMNLRVF